MVKIFFGQKYLTKYSQSRNQPQTPKGPFEVLNKNMQKKWQGVWIDSEIWGTLKYFTREDYAGS